MEMKLTQFKHGGGWERVSSDRWGCRGGGSGDGVLGWGRQLENQALLAGGAVHNYSLYRMDLLRCLYFSYYCNAKSKVISGGKYGVRLACK